MVMSKKINRLIALHTLCAIATGAAVVYAVQVAVETNSATWAGAAAALALLTVADVAAATSYFTHSDLREIASEEKGIVA
ncbi:MAG: hypothetical protein ACYCZ0_00765, partial [Minisyncoccota bacterium]